MGQGFKVCSDFTSDRYGQTVTSCHTGCKCHPLCKECEYTIVSREGEICGDCLQKCEECGKKQAGALRSISVAQPATFITYSSGSCGSCGSYGLLNGDRECKTCASTVTGVIKLVCPSCVMKVKQICDRCKKQYDDDDMNGNLCIHCTHGRNWDGKGARGIQTCVGCNETKITNDEDLCYTCYVNSMRKPKRCKRCKSLCDPGKTLCPDCIDTPECITCGAYFPRRTEKAFTCLKHSPRCLHCKVPFNPTNRTHVFCSRCVEKARAGVCLSCGSRGTLDGVGLGVRCCSEGTQPKCCVCNVNKVMSAGQMCDNCARTNHECPSCGKMTHISNYVCTVCAQNEY